MILYTGNCQLLVHNRSCCVPPTVPVHVTDLEVGVVVKARIPRHRHRHPRDDPSEDVGVGVVECGLNAICQ